MEQKEHTIYDHIIIGQGIAGTCIAWHLLEANQKFLVLDKPQKNNCSVVAAGIINPITGMRLTKTWLAEVIFPYAKEFYTNLEQTSGQKFWIDREIIRPTNDVEQLNDALSRISDGFLSDFLEYSEKEVELDKTLKAKHGYFKIKHGGNLLVNAFLDYSRKAFLLKKCFEEDWISPASVEYNDEFILVNGIKTKNIIWCTGNYQENETPFNYLPFSSTRGEMIRIKCKDLNPEFLYNKNSFVLHQKDDEFICGATFSHELDKTTSEEGLSFLLHKIKDLIKPDFEVIEHYFGIRPTVLDRKPFIGLHPKLRNTFIFNGLGAKGVTQGPYFAKEFVNFILDKKKLSKETDINRYFSRYL